MANTALDLRNGGDHPANAVTSAAVNSTENTLTVSITPGVPRIVQLVSDVAWYYRSTSGGASVAVAASVPLTLQIPQNSILYYIRAAGDGTLTILVLV